MKKFTDYVELLKKKETLSDSWYILIDELIGSSFKEVLKGIENNKKFTNIRTDYLREDI